MPVVAGLLYRAGGTDQWPWCPVNQKWWRWLMGFPLGFLCTIGRTSWETVLLSTALAGVTYYIATAVFKYGDKSWLNFLPKIWKFIVCGAALGAASWVLLPPFWAFMQVIIGGWAFGFIFILDECGYLHNPWVEFLRGYGGTFLL